MQRGLAVCFRRIDLSEGKYRDCCLVQAGAGILYLKECIDINPLYICKGHYINSKASLSKKLNSFHDALQHILLIFVLLLLFHQRTVNATISVIFVLVL